MAAAPLHDGLYGGIGLDAFKQLDFHAGFLQVADCPIQEAELLHGAAANTDDGLFALKGLQRFQSALAVVQVPGESESCHSNYLLCRFARRGDAAGC